ncbi:hypothetical protein LAZ67_13001172 [Cordylochernes scorpioides]|uniref:Integrase p58-like C-terminal domain-containing protein n=1 Tax=Cordylochernes scorpioides TaxID=51811 RepID=A0ABY6L6A4_9ARAC|nr:hypothetical protein LAZ67_13001172 [Cordylochernes scorpioides]
MKRYFGPYKVTLKVSDVTYEFGSTEPSDWTRQKTDLVHVLRMKPYHDVKDQVDLFKGLKSLPLSESRHGEIEKVAYLMKGIGESIFQALLTIEVVKEFCRHTRRIKDLFKKRIGKSQFEEYPSKTLLGLPRVLKCNYWLWKVLNFAFRNAKLGPNPGPALGDIISPQSSKRVFARTLSIAGKKNCAIESSKQLLLESELFIPSSYITRTTIAYHPQTNRLTERLSRTITDMLSMYTDLDLRIWDEMFPFITFFYNTARQEFIGFTSFFLLLGSEVEKTLGSIFPYSGLSDGKEFIQAVATRVEEARQIA